MVTSPVRWTRCRSRWSYRCCGRAVIGMGLIIGRFLTPLNSSRTMGSALGGVTTTRAEKVQNVRGDSSCRVSLEKARLSARASSIALIAHVYRAEKRLLLDVLKHLRETDQQ